MNKTATTMEDKLNDFLDIENTISDSKKIVKAKKQEIEYYDQEKERDKDIESDYNFQRETLYNLVQQGQEALSSLVQLAEQSQHPRAYEVAGQLMKTTGELAKDLIEMQAMMNKVRNTNDGVPNILIDDHIKNIREWEARGGIGVRHISPQKTISQLKKLGI